MHIDRSERLYLMIAGLLLLLFGVGLAVSSAAYGIRVPVPELIVDPRTVATDPNSLFSAPAADRIRQIAPGKYEVYILASTWKFSPGSIGYGEPPIRVPAGSTVTFYVTSMDIQHGFRLQDTNISFMVLPGQVSRLTATFDKPGEYDFICHEYCGAAHQAMFGKFIVEG